MSNSADAFRLTRPYATAVYGSALWQLANTLALYACTIALMFWTVTTPGIPYLATLALSLVASVGYMRLFMIGHDTSHDSFMPKKWENVVVGNLMGVLTNTPVAYWGRQHHLHHHSHHRSSTSATTGSTSAAFSLPKSMDEILRTPRSLPMG